MTNDMLGNILRLYTFLGILSVTKDGDKFRTSKFHANFNALKMPLVAVIGCFLTINREYLKLIFRVKLDDSFTYSNLLENI